MTVGTGNFSKTQWAIGGLALASVGVLAYSLVRPTRETNKKKKAKRKGPKAVKFEYKISKHPIDIHLVMFSDEGFHAHVAGDKKNKKLKFGAKLFKINEKKVENLTYEEISSQLQRVKAPARLTFKECPQIETDWTQAESFREKGNEFYKNGDLVQGIDNCSKAIALHPTNKVYYSNRVLMYLKTNQLDLALEDCQKIRELDPLSLYVKGHYLRGLVLLKLGKIKHAAAAFQTVMKLEPAFKQAKIRLDDCLNKLKVEESKQRAKIVEKRRSSEVLLLTKANSNKSDNAQAVLKAKASSPKEGENQGKSIFEDTAVVANGNHDDNKEDNVSNPNEEAIGGADVNGIDANADDDVDNKDAANDDAADAAPAAALPASPVVLAPAEESDNDDGNDDGDDDGNAADNSKEDNGQEDSNMNSPVVVENADDENGNGDDDADSRDNDAAADGAGADKQAKSIDDSYEQIAKPPSAASKPDVGNQEIEDAAAELVEQ